MFNSSDAVVIRAAGGPTGAAPGEVRPLTAAHLTDSTARGAYSGGAAQAVSRAAGRVPHPAAARRSLVAALCGVFIPKSPATGLGAVADGVAVLAAAVIVDGDAPLAAVAPLAAEVRPALRLGATLAGTGSVDFHSAGRDGEGNERCEDRGGHSRGELLVHNEVVDDHRLQEIERGREREKVFILSTHCTKQRFAHKCCNVLAGGWAWQ